MIIGGIQKTSLIDFPGRVACILFLSGCNFTCPYCHNPELLAGKPVSNPELEKDAVFSFLEERCGFIDGVVISGGEPTLTPDIDALCRDIRKMGLLIKLDTNGSRPNVLSQLLEKDFIDYVAMDLKTVPEQYAPVFWKNARPSEIRKSIRLILNSGIPHEFRTTCVAPIISKESMVKMAEAITGANLYVLQQCRQERVLNPDFFGPNKGRRMEDNELENLRSIAARYVKECTIR